MSGRRKVVLLTGVVLAIAVALHPPWTAHVAVSKMDFQDFPAVPPRLVTDTASWKVPFAPVYSPPTLDLEPDELAAYQRRLNAGDTSAATDWRRRVEAIERRYRVPEQLRSAWISGASSGSTGVAFRRSIVSSRFEIDRSRFGLHLLAIIAIVFVFALLTRRRPSTANRSSGEATTAG